MQYDEKLSKYYDLIFMEKKYKKEVDFIKESCYNKVINSILDIGCGTGNHSILLSEDKTIGSILGIDESESMISVANNKIKDSSKIKFISKSLCDIEKDNFDLVISMFNVINHISSISELSNFFNEIFKRLDEGGIFIFDCWNGAATMRDPPKSEKRKRFENEKMSIITTCNPEIDFMNSVIAMNNEVEIKHSCGEVDFFKYTINHTIWTPKIIGDLLKNSGFRTVKVNKFFDHKEANCDDYKVVYVCRG